MRRNLLLMAVVALLAANFFLVLQTLQGPWLDKILDPQPAEPNANLREALRLVNKHQDPQPVGTADPGDLDKLRENLDQLDAHSGYLEKSAFRHFQRLTRGEYVGIGIVLYAARSTPVISRVFPGSPAHRSGLRIGDEIVAIDRENLDGLSLDQVVERLRGPAGSELDMQLYRPGPQEHFPVTLRRGDVKIPSVTETRLLPDSQIAYIRLNRFARHTPEDFIDALANLEEQNPSALILDLRDNPGGLLETAIEIADIFLPTGKTIVTTRQQKELPGETIRSHSPPSIGLRPVVILINRHTASAAEILAGTLHAHEIATLVGERSVGKGSVQSVFALRNGDGVKMTTAHYYLPDGRAVNQIGLVPDLTVALDKEEARNLSLQRLHPASVREGTFSRAFGIPPRPDRVLQAAKAWISDQRNSH